MHEAKTHLSALVRSLKSGAESEIIIAVDGEPAAKIVPHGAPQPRRLGIDQGLITIAPDFDEPNAAIAALFEGDT
jgi:antitoxin (DNA-binding transcriptional repressor) of toxin-antitoxin stability system